MTTMVTMASGKWTERNKIQVNGPFGAVLITFMKSFGRPKGYQIISVEKLHLKKYIITRALV